MFVDSLICLKNGLWTIVESFEKLIWKLARIKSMFSSENEWLPTMINKVKLIKLAELKVYGKLSSLSHISAICDICSQNKKLFEAKPK